MNKTLIAATLRRKVLTEWVSFAGSMNPNISKYSAEKADVLKAQSFNRATIAGRGLKYERLDQSIVYLLFRRG